MRLYVVLVCYSIYVIQEYLSWQHTSLNKFRVLLQAMFGWKKKVRRKKEGKEKEVKKKNVTKRVEF